MTGDHRWRSVSDYHCATNIRPYAPVNPSLECALIVVTTLLNIFAGTTCTSSRRIKPHSRDVRKSIIFFASCDRFVVLATMEYVEITMPLSPANWKIPNRWISPVPPKP